MKKVFSRTFDARILFALVPCLLCCVVVGAQTRTQTQVIDASYLISAKAGKVNALAGKASAQLGGSQAWRALTLKDELDSGDALRTEAGGRVELLLNPGSYLRIAENSEVEFADASLDNLRIKVLRGSAIIEATGTSGTRLLATVITPQTKILIDRNGLYRVNVAPSAVAATATTEVLVYKGRAFVGSNTLTTLKGNSKIVVAGVNIVPPQIAKFDKKNSDGFDLWSRERADALIAANRDLTRRDMSNVLASYRSNGANGYGYAPYFGLWVFNNSLNCYTFLPFYSRWSSPYGFDYQNNFGIPWYYYSPNPPSAQPPVIPGNNGGGVIANPPVAGVPVLPPHKGFPTDPDNPDPIGGVRPIRPVPIGEGTERFDRAFEGSRNPYNGNNGMNSSAVSGSNNSGNSVGIPSPPPPPVQQQIIEAPRPPERMSSPERNVQP